MKASTHLSIRELTRIPPQSLGSGSIHTRGNFETFSGSPSSQGYGKFSAKAASTGMSVRPGNTIVSVPETNNDTYIFTIFSKKVVFPLLLVLILGVLAVGIVVPFLRSESQPNEPQTLQTESKVDVRLQINITGVLLTPTYATYLRCSISNRTGTSGNDITITSWTESNGTVFEVTPTDPLNTGNCSNHTIRNRRQRVLSSQKDNTFRQLYIIPISPISITLSMRVNPGKITSILSHIREEMGFNVSTLSVVQPQAQANTPSPSASSTSSQYESTSNYPPVGCTILKDINLGNQSSNAGFLVEVGNISFFAADDGIHGMELWKSDGTSAGTSLVKDINPGNARSLPDTWTISFTVMGTVIFFAADDGIHGIELWKSDGTSTGTSLVRDINVGNESSLQSTWPSYFTVMGTVIFFAADDGIHGMELWKSDGTSTGTSLVKDIKPGKESSTDYYHRPWAVMGNYFYFAANRGNYNWNLWKSDGTTSGTTVVNTSIGTVNWVTVIPGNVLYVNGFDFIAGRGGLWKSDGTSAGTSILTYNIFSAGVHFLTVGNILYFTGYDEIHGVELWKSDGTSAGTSLVKDIYPGIGHSYPRYLTIYGNSVFFQADDGIHDGQLWKSDGTSSGTSLVKIINPGSTVGGWPSYLTVMGNLLYFKAYDEMNGPGLWRSDGTVSGTSLVKDINPQSELMWGFLEDMPMFVSGNELYFSSDDGINGMELWKCSTALATNSSTGSLIASSTPVATRSNTRTSSKTPSNSCTPSSTPSVSPLPAAILPNVTICNQMWQSMNLNVTTYRDGTPIPEVTNFTIWSTLTTGAWCHYRNDPEMGNIYGKLYNWYAIMGIHDNDPNTPNKILAPQGWHVSTSNDWYLKLIPCIGDQSTAGGPLKAPGTKYWNEPNFGATNSTGFDALPGGFRDVRNKGNYLYIGQTALFWVYSTPPDSKSLSSNHGWVSSVANGNEYKNEGLSVRCVKDAPSAG